ncbi:MAG: hypothetical protein LBL72_07465 [Candidatus Accumulibacter sp.]|jgi:hypothetical protein|nr:hypothetical protein [Accumulibacter sp.]
MTGFFRNLAFLAFLSLSSAAWGEGVYVTEGPNGPTFSNVPQEGSKEINLRPLTVIQSPKQEGAATPPPARGATPRARDRGTAPRVTPPPPGAALEPAYREFSVLWPLDNGSVIINPGTFDVRVSVDPALRLEEGHAFAVSINGDPVRERFTSTEFMIPPEFWGEAIPMNQFASLQASIVDKSGSVLKLAEPIRFMMRFTTVLQNPNRSSRRHVPGSILPGGVNFGSDRHPPRPDGPGKDSWQGDGTHDHTPGGKPPSGKWGGPHGPHGDGAPPTQGGSASSDHLFDHAVSSASPPDYALGHGALPVSDSDRHPPAWKGDGTHDHTPGGKPHYGKWGGPHGSQAGTSTPPAQGSSASTDHLLGHTTSSSSVPDTSLGYGALPVSDSDRHPPAWKGDGKFDHPPVGRPHYGRRKGPHGQHADGGSSGKPGKGAGASSSAQGGSASSGTGGGKHSVGGKKG